MTGPDTSARTRSVEHLAQWFSRQIACERDPERLRVLRIMRAVSIPLCTQLHREAPRDLPPEQMFDLAHSLLASFTHTMCRTMLQSEDELSDDFAAAVLSSVGREIVGAALARRAARRGH